MYGGLSRRWELLAPGGVMETFTFDPRRWWIGRLFARNPLLRRTDRTEALAIVLAIGLSLLGVPAAGAVGTDVYTARSSRYAHEAQTRHPVSATVTEAAAATASSDTGTVDGQARWQTDRATHTASFESLVPVKVGDRVDIWVDGNGNEVDPPTPTSRAGFDAINVAAPIELVVVAASVALVAATRWWLDRIRNARWENDLKALAGGGDGRANGIGPRKT
jgi:hypothetical protein